MFATLSPQERKLVQLERDQRLTEKQLQVALSVGFITDIFKAAKKGTLRTSNRAEIQRFLKVGLLKQVGTVTLTATLHFVAKDAFRAGNKAGVKFYDCRKIFATDLLPQNYEEKNIPSATLKILRTQQNCNQNELVREGVSRVFLTYLWELLTRQPKGQKPDGKSKVLLTNGARNIFEIKGTKCVVHARWTDKWYPAAYGWDVGAGNADYPHGFGVGNRVFCSDSDVLSP